MTPIHLFGSKEFPLHCSQLNMLLACPFRAVLLHMGLTDDTSGEAADTGSAMHAAAAAWHTGKGEEAALEEMRARIDEYKLADLNEAANIFRAYSKDPRNTRAKLAAVEQKIAFELPPAEHDPTREAVHIVGTLDQVRDDRGLMSVWDIKTTKRSGSQVADSYAMQVAAYTIGAQKLLGIDVQPGGLILARVYLQKGVLAEMAPPKVFWHCSFTLEDAYIMLASVVDVVGWIRSGYFIQGPGEHCNYCPAGGVTSCTRKLKSLLTVK